MVRKEENLEEAKVLETRRASGEEKLEEVRAKKEKAKKAQAKARARRESALNATAQTI